MMWPRHAEKKETDPMSISCSQGHVNPDGSMFCDECGERLSPQPVGAPAMASATAMGGGIAVAAGSPRLTVQSDNAVFDLSGKTEAVIGREDPASNVYPDVDLTPHGGEDGGVSRTHAKLYLQGGQYLVEDQNSTNATFVNKQKLAPKTPTPIKDGDELRLGRVVLRFSVS
jgi:pSer/pThr/pTyr-binding forkhead associated (FHA) protein